MGFADERTLEVLEFPAVRDRVVAATATERGRAYATALLPTPDFARVRREQSRTAAARSLLESADLYILPAIETEPLTTAAAQGRVLSAHELRQLGDAVGAAAAAHRAVREDDILRELTHGYEPLDALRRGISDAIDERDAIRDRASAALARIRKSRRQAEEESRERVASILRAPKYANVIQDAVVTIRDGRFVIPIKAEFAGEFAGIVHDTSASGRTLFVEPLAAIEANNRVRTLHIEELREIERILTELSRSAGDRAPAIEGNVEILALLDVLIAKARVARAMEAVPPELDEAAMLEIEDGRHPLLGDRAVAQSLAIGEDPRLLVISGPNMGGKTVSLKTVGLFVAMAYAGMQIPARHGSRIGRFECLFADIGDEQSIAANASSFSGHLDRLREMLALAGERTLFLVDEIGAGTEPSAGAALARAMLERLLAARARGVVTTHSTELKLFAHGAEGARNASVRFDPQTFEPTYHLDLGTPGQSLSLSLARSRGIDAEVVSRAEQLLEEGEREYEEALEQLAARSAQLQAQLEEAERERRAGQEERAALLRERGALDAERARFVQRAEERMQQALRDFARELESRSREPRQKGPRVTPAQSAALTRTLEEMRRELGLAAEEQQQKRTVKLDLPLSGVHVQPRSPSVELDVRGKRYVEAEPIVDRWIDDALLAGHSPLRLIHGKGSGMLGRGLQAFLRDHPAVASIRYGTEEEGSSGVTIIELR